MRNSTGQPGFTLIELVAVLAIILLLAGVLLGISKHITRRAEADLTASELEVLATALQQYYDDTGNFPFVTDIDGNGISFTDQNGNGIFDDEDLADYGENALETDPRLDGSVIPNGSIDGLGNAAASSAALFYFLDQNPNSRKIIEAVSETLVTTQNASGVPITFTFNSTSQTIDLPRFVDAWGTSIRYEYIDGTAFPVLTAAGPDKTFGTADDIVN